MIVGQGAPFSMSWVCALNPLQNAAAAARCPPAEPPAAIMRSGSMPSSAAWPRTQRMVLLASWTHTSGALPWVLRMRYSAHTVTSPRSAK